MGWPLKPWRGGWESSLGRKAARSAPAPSGRDRLGGCTSGAARTDAFVPWCLCLPQQTLLGANPGTGTNSPPRVGPAWVRWARKKQQQQNKKGLVLQQGSRERELRQEGPQHCWGGRRAGLLCPSRPRSPQPTSASCHAGWPSSLPTPARPSGAGMTPHPAPRGSLQGAQQPSVEPVPTQPKYVPIPAPACAQPWAAGSLLPDSARGMPQG